MNRHYLVLAAALILSGCAPKATVGPKIDPALATLVPDDTTLLVGTRLEALAKTPVYQKYLADRKFPQVEDFAKQTGLDPQKDLWELLFVSNGKNNGPARTRKNSRMKWSLSPGKGRAPSDLDTKDTTWLGMTR